MKNTKSKRIVAVTIMALTGLVGFLLVARAGDLEPTDPPGPTMKTLDEVEPRIPIPASATPAAPFIISNPGSYYLVGDRTASGNGIEVNVDNVTIDLMGYQLIGPGTGTNHGIYMSGRKNVEIRNGMVRNFGDRGISEDNGSEHRVIGVRAMSNGGAGIILMGNSHLVKDCNAAHNGHAGIYIRTDGLVTGCKAWDNSFVGILTDGTGSTVSGCTAYDNDNRGIHARNGSTVIGNTAYNNPNSEGIQAGDGSTVVNNTSYDNHVGFTTGTGCSFIGNTAYSNTFRGFSLGSYNCVNQNTARNNGTNLVYGSGCQFGVNVD